MKSLTILTDFSGLDTDSKIAKADRLVVDTGSNSFKIEDGILECGFVAKKLRISSNCLNSITTNQVIINWHKIAIEIVSL